MRRLLNLLTGILATLAQPILHAGNDWDGSEADEVRQFISQQKAVHSVSADFVQTRSLKTLRSPIEVKGHVWLSTSGRYRWQLGDPPRTIIIGSPEGTTLIEPLKKHAEILRSSDNFGSPAAFSPLGFSGSRGMEELKKNLRFLSLNEENGRCCLSVLPRDPSAAARLSAINLDFNKQDGRWIGFEIVTREGSSIRTVFSNTELNAPLQRDLFSYDLTGFTVAHDKK